MKIKLLHLYYDILNIYGENGNMRALVKALEYQGLKVNVDFKTIDDEINFNDYDFIYVGSGLDESIDITFEDLKKYGSELKVKEAGKMRLEGKDYLMQDGDIVYFRFNV